MHTVTADNGKEFAGHARVAEALGAGFFFARHCHSWERGLNEHVNGLVREWFPKGTDFRKVTDEAVKAVQDRTDARPRKALGYLTPSEAFLPGRSRPEVAVPGPPGAAPRGDARCPRPAVLRSGSALPASGGPRTAPGRACTAPEDWLRLPVKGPPPLGLRPSLADVALRSGSGDLDMGGIALLGQHLTCGQGQHKGHQGGSETGCQAVKGGGGSVKRVMASLRVAGLPGGHKTHPAD